MFEFFVEIENYDNDFMFYLGESRVEEGRTIKFTGKTPLAAYENFVASTEIHSECGKSTFTSEHIKYFRTLFYKEIGSFLRSRVNFTTAPVLEGVRVDTDGCFEQYHGGNQEFLFGVRKVHDFKVTSHEEFQEHLAKLQAARAAYVAEMTAAYDADTFLPAVDALEAASHEFGKQNGLVAKTVLKGLLNGARSGAGVPS